MRERIKQAMARAFSLNDPAQIPDDVRINAFKAWDSVAHLMLMLELENEFGVRIATDTMLDLTGMAEITAFLEQSGVAQ